MADQETPQTAQQAAPTPGSTITPAGVPRSVEDRLTAIETSAEQPAPQPVAPLRQPEPVPPAPVPASAPAPPVPAPAPAPVTVPQPVPAQPTPVPAPVLTTRPQLHIGQAAIAAPAQDEPFVDDDGALTWTASEFVAHAKSAQWYAALAGAAALGTAIIYLLTKDVISSVVVIVCALAFGFYAGRQPRQIRYVLAPQGVGVGQRFFPFNEMRSFSVAPDGAFSSIIFRPLKRFGMFTTIYYPPEYEDQIVTLLADHLPFEEHRPDPVDRLMSKIRF